MGVFFEGKGGLWWGGGKWFRLWVVVGRWGEFGLPPVVVFGLFVCLFVCLFLQGLLWLVVENNWSVWGG